MKKHLLLWPLVALTIVGGALFVTVMRWPEQAHGEPAFRGKPARYWGRGVMDEVGEVRRTGILVEFGLVSEYVTWYRQALEEGGREAVPVLLALRHDPNPLLRQEVLGILSKIGPVTEAVVPAIIEALRDGDATDRWAAATFLGEMGPAAHQAIPDLRQRLEAPDPDIRARIEAAFALWKVGGRHEPSVRALAEALEDEKAGYMAAARLGEMGPQAADAVPGLIRALNRRGSVECETGREVAAEALGKIGPAARAAVPALTDLRNDSSYSVQTRAAAALEKINPRPTARGARP